MNYKYGCIIAFCWNWLTFLRWWFFIINAANTFILSYYLLRTMMNVWSVKYLAAAVFKGKPHSWPIPRKHVEPSESSNEQLHISSHILNQNWGSFCFMTDIPLMFLILMLIIIIININIRTVFMVLTFWEFTMVRAMNAEQHTSTCWPSGEANQLVNCKPYPPECCCLLLLNGRSWYTEGKGLSQPRWLVSGHLPIRRWSPITVLTGPGIE